MNVTRVLQNTAATITWTAYDDGTATDIGTVTLGIVDQDGTTIVAAGTAVTSDGGDGTYTYDITYDLTATLGVWTVTWTEAGGEAFVTYVEIIGSLLVTEAELRAFDNSAMTSATVYTDAALAEARNSALDRLEYWTGRSWVPRFGQVKGPGTGGYSFWLGDGIRQYGGAGFATDTISIVSASITGSAITAGNVVADRLTGELLRTDGLWSLPTTANPRNVTVNYTYGQRHPVDGVDHIIKLLVKDELVATAISDRASSYTDELGTLRFTTPGLGGAVSTIPEVNEWVRTHRLVTL